MTSSPDMVSGAFQMLTALGIVLGGLLEALFKKGYRGLERTADSGDRQSIYRGKKKYRSGQGPRHHPGDRCFK